MDKWQDRELNIEVMHYWMPVAWELWSEEKAIPVYIPAYIPEDIWVEHAGHEASMRSSALGISNFICHECQFHWSKPVN